MAHSDHMEERLSELRQEIREMRDDLHEVDKRIEAHEQVCEVHRKRQDEAMESQARSLSTLTKVVIGIFVVELLILLMGSDAALEIFRNIFIG